MMRKFFVISAFMGILTACSNEPAETVVDDEVQIDHQNTAEIVARINGQDLTLAELDNPIKLGLYDLEWQKYQLRRESLKRFMDIRGGDAEVFLLPPEPPRLQISYGDRSIRGDEDAPVLLAVFCSFQSSHCARLQPVLQQLRDDNGANIALAYFDFPQGFHRYGMDAAMAVRCAFEQDDNWDYLDSMFGIYDDLNLNRFTRLAVQTGLTPNRFTACMSKDQFRGDIEDDISYAKSLGFGRVPIVLVNGLYVKGPQTAPAYQYHIDRELIRLGIEAIETPETPDIENEVEAEEDYTPRGLGEDRVRDTANLPPRDKSSITLSRNWVNTQLSDEAALMDYFYKADHAPEGNHVLKLSDVSGNDFFETMGFRKNDVILQVNGEWMHENKIGLWNELRYAKEVEVKLMRRGKPVTYYYRFGE